MRLFTYLDREAEGSPEGIIRRQKDGQERRKEKEKIWMELLCLCDQAQQNGR